MKSRQPLVYVVILNWNGLSMTKRCLSDLHAQTYQNYKIVVVDNGSTDGSIEWLSEQPLHLIQNSKNRGFARAINQGFKIGVEEHAKYVVSLNNDVELDKEWLHYLVEGMEKNPSFGFAQGASMTQDNKQLYDSTGIYLEKGFIPNQRALHKETPCLEIPAIGPNAAGAIYRTTMLSKVCYKDHEYFDRRFFAYVEDVDFNLRCTLRGFELGYIKKAILYHKGSATGNRIAKRKMFWGARNMVWLIYKNAPYGVFRANFKIIIKSHIANLQFLFINQSKNFMPYVAGIISGLAGLPLFIAKRRNNLKQIVLTADEFNGLLLPSNPPVKNPFRKLVNLLRYK